MGSGDVWSGGIDEGKGLGMMKGDLDLIGGVSDLEVRISIFEG